MHLYAELYLSNTMICNLCEISQDRPLPLRLQNVRIRLSLLELEVLCKRLDDQYKERFD